MTASCRPACSRGLRTDGILSAAVATVVVIASPMTAGATPTYTKTARVERNQLDRARIDWLGHESHDRHLHVAQRNRGDADRHQRQSQQLQLVKFVFTGIWNT